MRKLRKKLNTVKNNMIYVGYFNDQGIHEESGIRYVDLMTIHEFGSIKNKIPPRPVLNLTQEGGEFSSRDKIVIKNAFRGVFVKDIPISQVFDRIGSYYREKAYSIFGSSALLPTKRGNSPLIITSDLKENVSYRTSFTYKKQ